MENIKIYVRTDLRTSSGKKVPNGKMAAQSAHALMAIFLGLFKKEEDLLVLNDENIDLFNAFKENKVNIEYVPLKEEDLVKLDLTSDNVFPIIDQGRTVFSEPTMTTIGLAPKIYKYSKTTDCKSETGERYGAKQVIVINKEEIKDKWEMYSVVSTVALSTLIDLTFDFQDQVVLPLEHKGLKAWINGAFAKITLQPKENTALDLMAKLNNMERSNLLHSTLSEGEKLKAIAVGPDFIEKVDKLTKDGYKLA